jgi:glycosyltransferase involved in cell wall biosynthesis
LDVSFLTTAGGDMEYEFENSGVKFYKRVRKVPIDFAVIFEIRRILIRENIDIIHCHLPVNLLHSFIARVGTNAKIVFTHHGNQPGFSKDNIVDKLLYRFIDANIFVSSAFMNQAIEESGYRHTSNFRIVHNGIDTKRIKQERSSLKRELGIPKTTRILGMVGNFNWGRNQLFICKALPKIFSKYADVIFVFVGAKQPNAEHLFNRCVDYCREASISSRVFFLGARSDISNILAGLDIFVYCSLRDTFGIALIEALLANVPVVANDLPAFRELSIEGNYFDLYQSWSLSDLENKTSYCLENLRIKKESVKAQKSSVSNQYSIESHLRKLKEVYRSLLV